MTVSDPKQYYLDNKDRFRRNRLRRDYGITPEEYADMLIEQNGVCAICENPETRILHGDVCMLSIDHDHGTGKIRGLLCFSCNTKLGILEQKVWSEKAFEYLEREQS